MGQSPQVLRKDTEQKRSGTGSLRFDFAAPNNVGWVGQWVYQTHPDTEYRIQGFIKQALGAKIELNLTVEPNLGGLALPAAEEWTPWEWTFNSQEATTLLPEFRFRGSGSVWLDDLRLVQVSEPGTRVLPERQEILKLLEYQAHPVPPETNTDEWTRPYLGDMDAKEAFAQPGPPGFPRFQVGQWVRYLCQDNLLVPSIQPEKRPHVTLIDCAIVGREEIAGKTYFWYQSVVRQQRYWVARSTGLYDSREKILLERSRKVVLSLLVEGPEFQEVRRYQLQVGDELLEYTDGERAVLPRLNVDHALIRPLAQPPQGNETTDCPPVRLGEGEALAEPLETAQVTATLNSQVPVTGLVALEYHGPHLDRSARLVNWGEQGAQDERGPDPPLVLRLARPPYVAVSFDGFGELQHYQEMVAAGAEWFQHQTVLYLGEARTYFNQMPAYFFSPRRWDVDVFDLCRSNLRGFSPHLDEPYQRQRKPNEYVKRGEVQTLREAAARYSVALAGLLQPTWPGEEIMDYNSPSSAAWYSARVGAAGFVLENARLTTELEDIAKVAGRPEARALADELNIACMRGAARRFGGWWGQGIYRWVPQRYWRPEWTYYAERGARYLGFWIDGGPGSRDAELSFYQTVRAALPDLVQAVKSIPPQPVEATAVIVVPDGYVVGFSGSAPEAPWGILEFPPGRRITEKVIARAAELYGQGLAFDIVVDDPDHPPALEQYKQVFRAFVVPP